MNNVRCLMVSFAVGKSVEADIDSESFSHILGEVCDLY